MDKYECQVCGYIYDPALGDPDGGIAPGTPFEKLPADWVCPSAARPRTCSKRPSRWTSRRRGRVVAVARQ